MLIGGIMESLSISLVLPLISAVMDEAGWNQSWYGKILCSIFHIENHHSYIKLLLIILIVIFIVKNIYLYIEYHIQYTFIAKGRYEMQSKLIMKYMNKPYSFYLYANSGEILRIIKTDTAQTFILLTNVINFFMELVVGVVVAVTVFAINPVIAIIIVIVLLAEVVVIAKVVKPRFRRYGEVVRTASADASKWVIQSINGIKSIKVEQQEEYFATQYKKHLYQEIFIGKKQQVLDNVPKLITESVTVAAVLSLLLVYLMNGSEMSVIVSQLSAFVVAAMRLMPCANRISASINQVPFYEGAADNVIRNLEIEGRYVDEAAETIAEITNDKDGFKCEDNIVFEDISFAYEKAERKILDHANAEIKIGQSIGVVGSSGAGKTTAIDLLLGLLKPQEGKVLVDGTDIKEDMSGWLANVAYIPQQIFMVDDTIRNNIAFGRSKEDIDEEKVLRAVKEAQLEEFISELPNGLDTRIGEAGVRVSGGQRQRIGIARALYNDPEVMVFDEATSALDNETEAAIMEFIDGLKGKRTLIIIAHRLSTIQNCDIVYRIQDGKISVDNEIKNQ